MPPQSEALSWLCKHLLGSAEVNHNAKAVYPVERMSDSVLASTVQIRTT
ncbi:MAG: hypothetical protein H6727_02645 [Myxococcales bacterium]|nr:hypothetical protein [Myxococcales bacterium]MCB9637788.1 hypothetical protein [Myxococcales bacterium]